MGVMVLLAVVSTWAAAGPSGGGLAPPALALRARAFQPGELVVMTVRVPADTTSVAVRAFDRDVAAFRVAAEEWRALVGIDLDVTPGDYLWTARTAAGETSERVTVAPRAFPVRTLTVNPDFVNPPPKVQQRIADEARLVEAVYAAPDRMPAWEGPFRRPVPHNANSRFGTRSVFNGEARNPHGGTDFLSPAGTPVHAPNAGRVAVARDLYFSGRTVLLDHGAGVFSQLAHLSRIDVKEGETVRAGHVVGLVGATGRVTGAHLHWGVRVAGARVDALSLLALLGAPKQEMK